MNTRHLLAVAALLLSAAVSRPMPCSVAPPVPGPGGVATAVLEFLARQDAAGDVAALLIDRRHEIDFVVVDGRLEVVEGAKAAMFADVAADGTPVEAADAAAFARLLGGRVARDAKAASALRSEVHSIRADCDSERCSSAIVGFDRHYTDATGAQRTVPMQATVLLSYDREAPGGAFRIWHWHASPRPAAGAAEVGRTERGAR